uniref:DUF924-domain-containing protein n=1 Tax=Octactis speculum TaxID=3111310 RepID=A0A7S2C4Y7_9STRA|mmetsp:Transcript_31454/g.42589  ORF Transcript_31454/g.42589 Transcript_31454/m.42589 type:complete len:296 (+) Transcript_31454:176-1063(+)|eukprot:CAMPEP_0185798036 /NCGR_PEP_ID=MMETSP1174-20130828/161930_1 /TAXON_ID=35687 /ORGANISM="Dictyocha speculum, Strain CCMP1381" /LENGTH=295 /DNA_ID=CAMNT_0028493505 /DNA_START=170 /DNA_END=1057 /DNA_ORIENTATION=+
MFRRYLGFSVVPLSQLVFQKTNDTRLESAPLAQPLSTGPAELSEFCNLVRLCRLLPEFSLVPKKAYPPQTPTCAVGACTDLEVASTILQFWFHDPSGQAPLASDSQESDSESHGVIDVVGKEGIQWRWFNSGSKWQSELRSHPWRELHTVAFSGRFDHYAEEGADTMLALILIFDQVTRTLYRGTKRAYEGDTKALALAKRAVAEGMDQHLPSQRRIFLYFPFMHSERLVDQETAVGLFRKLAAEDPVLYGSLLQTAKAHRDTVRRFGRLPERNRPLGRASTPGEEAFLAKNPTA